MTAPALPADVVWDITYACPLRCTHCYSESGRRPARQLSRPDLLRVTDAIISMQPAWVSLAGGEPLVVPGIFEVAERFSTAGIPVVMYTGGWSLDADTAERLTRVCARVNVSIDGATAEVHDRIRGRRGSFDRAMQALARLDEAATRRRADGDDAFQFGIDCTVVRSSFQQLAAFCTDIAPRFPALSFLWFGAAMPIGLASRSGFVAHELLSDAEADELVSAESRARLTALAPASVQVNLVDNRLLQVHPDHIAQGHLPFMQIEPDGAVRAMPIYEGTVGSLLDEAPEMIWKRAAQRWTDPIVTEALRPVRTMAQWAEAARHIDRHFGSDQVRDRIDRRPPYPVPSPV